MENETVDEKVRVEELEEALRVASWRLARAQNRDGSNQNLERWKSDALLIKDELLADAQKRLAGAHAEEKGLK